MDNPKKAKLNEFFWSKNNTDIKYIAGLWLKRKYMFIKLVAKTVNNPFPKLPSLWKIRLGGTNKINIKKIINICLVFILFKYIDNNIKVKNNGKDVHKIRIIFATL